VGLHRKGHSQPERVSHCSRVQKGDSPPRTSAKPHVPPLEALPLNKSRCAWSAFCVSLFVCKPTWGLPHASARPTSLPVRGAKQPPRGDPHARTPTKTTASLACPFSRCVSVSLLCLFGGWVGDGTACACELRSERANETAASERARKTYRKALQAAGQLVCLRVVTLKVALA